MAHIKVKVFWAHVLKRLLVGILTVDSYATSHQNYSNRQTENKRNVSLAHNARQKENSIIAPFLLTALVASNEKEKTKNIDNKEIK